MILKGLEAHKTLQLDIEVSLKINLLWSSAHPEACLHQGFEMTFLLKNVSAMQNFLMIRTKTLNQNAGIPAVPYLSVI